MRTLDGLGDIPSAVDITVGISDATVCVHLRNVQHLNLGCAGKVLIPETFSVGVTVVFASTLALEPPTKSIVTPETP